VLNAKRIGSGILDFGSLKVVGLILSEALREELIRLGHFALVNRENLVQVLKEIELQMTGLGAGGRAPGPDGRDGAQAGWRKLRGSGF